MKSSGKGLTERVAATLCVALLALLCSTCFVVSVSAAPDAWDGTVALSFDGGDGSAASPYLISDAAQLAYFASTVVRSSNAVTYEGMYVKLTADIVLNTLPANPNTTDILSGTEIWTPIGSLSKPFMGYFDGDGHSVSGMYINGALESVGLFGCVKNATIRNVNIENAYVFSYGHNGTLIGIYTADRVNEGYTVENCNVINSTVHNDQAAFGQTGGVIGSVNVNKATLNISTCTAIGVTVTGYGSEMGGVIGSVYASDNGIINISGCRSQGYVSCLAKASNSIGGAFGAIKSSDSYITVRLSASDDDLTGKGKMLGGFVGYIRSEANGKVEVERCYSSGNVTGYLGNTERLGAFAGEAASFSTGSIVRVSDCFSTGNVTNDGEYTGGIVGRLYAQLSTTEVIRCYYAGVITGASLRGAVIGGAYVPPRSIPATVLLQNCVYYCLSADTAYGGNSGADASKLIGSLSGTTAELSKSVAYTGYDFDSVWEMKSNSSYRFPTIRGLEYQGEYTHRSEYKITIRYIDKDGNELLPMTEHMFETGGRYAINPGKVAKYTATPSSFSGVMGMEPLEFTFVYTQTQFPSHKLSISYLLDNGDNAAPEFYDLINEYSDFYVKSPQLTGYTADRLEVSGTMGVGDLLEHVTYRINSHMLRINYIMPDGGNAADSYTAMFDYGARYDIVSPVVAGYYPSLGKVEGYMPDTDVTVTVKFNVLKYTVSIRYIYSDGSEAAPIYNEKFDCGNYYSIVSPKIDGYVSSYPTVSGTLTSDVSVTVTYNNSPKIQVVPEMPQLDAIGNETLCIKPLTPPENAEILYGIADVNDPSKVTEWVPGINFVGLAPGGRYYIFARIPENLYYVEGISVGLAVTTKLLDRTLSAGDAENISTNGFKVAGYTVTCNGEGNSNAVDDGKVEYGISSVSTQDAAISWQTSDIFTGLEEGTTYYYFVRITESNRYSDIISDARRVTTSSKSEKTEEHKTTEAPETTESATITDEFVSTDNSSIDTQGETLPISGGGGCKGITRIPLLVCLAVVIICATALCFIFGKTKKA